MGHIKYDHRPKLVSGLDFGTAWSKSLFTTTAFKILIQKLLGHARLRLYGLWKNHFFLSYLDMGIWVINVISKSFVTPDCTWTSAPLCCSGETSWTGWTPKQGKIKPGNLCTGLKGYCELEFLLYLTEHVVAQQLPLWQGNDLLKLPSMLCHSQQSQQACLRLEKIQYFSTVGIYKYSHIL